MTFREFIRARCWEIGLPDDHADRVIVRMTTDPGHAMRGRWDDQSGRYPGSILRIMRNEIDRIASEMTP
jgi:hypothetical protein